METETQKFMEAEETAEKLVHTLQALHSEATSYQTATKELDTVRQQLLELIESTEKVLIDSHESIKVLKDIGGPEILSKLEQIEANSTQQFASQSKRFDKLNMIVLLALACSIGALVVGVLAFLK